MVTVFPERYTYVLLRVPVNFSATNTTLALPAPIVMRKLAHLGIYLISLSVTPSGGFTIN